MCVGEGLVCGGAWGCMGEGLVCGWVVGVCVGKRLVCGGGPERGCRCEHIVMVSEY